MLLDIVKIYLIIGTMVSIAMTLIDLYGKIVGLLPIPTGKALLCELIAHFTDIIIWPYSVVIMIKTFVDGRKSPNPIQYYNDCIDDIQDLYDRTNGEKE